jgi:flavin-dependent dehydrogenase
MISSTYAYLVPKDDLYLVGLGVSKADQDGMARFKNWLGEEFSFKPRSLVKREAWAIPFGSTFEGRNNVILVGDAAGFCNTLSGEGIRLAIESGVTASHSIQHALSQTESLSQLYAKDVEAISRFVHDVHNFTISLSEEGREEFVNTELARL